MRHLGCLFAEAALARTFPVFAVASDFVKMFNSISVIDGQDCRAQGTALRSSHLLPHQWDIGVTMDMH